MSRQNQHEVAPSAALAALFAGEPAFLAVVSGKGYGYRRADGVAVVSVAALAP